MSAVQHLVRVAKDQRIAVPSQQAITLGHKLAKLVSDDPAIPDLWPTSSILASYRSQLENGAAVPSDSLPNCEDVQPSQRSNLEFFLNTPQPWPDMPKTDTTPYIYKNCTLVLDDIQRLFKNNFHMEVGRPQGGPPQGLLTPPYEFDTAIIVYRGGPVPQSVLTFKNCVFRIEIPSQPEPPARQLLLALLQNPNEAVFVLKSPS
jgi:hypothetical protein